MMRCGNVYGPRQDPHGDAGVIAIFCGRVLAGHRPIVFGDGRQARDYVFASDIVAAIWQRPGHGTGSGEYNIGNRKEVSVLELAAAVAAAAGVDPASFESESAPDRPGELDRSRLDVARARHNLGPPPPMPLVKGLAMALSRVARTVEAT